MHIFARHKDNIYFYNSINFYALQQSFTKIKRQALNVCLIYYHFEDDGRQCSVCAATNANAHIVLNDRAFYIYVNNDAVVTLCYSYAEMSALLFTWS